MTRFTYTLLFYLAVPLILLRLLYRSLKAPAYRRRVAERFGYFQLPPDFKHSERSIWVHSVSVGETLAAVPLVKYLLKAYPHKSIVVTTMTPTGSERVKDVFGESVLHTYLPYDLPGAMKRFVQKINPALLIILETELWPNALHQCQLAGVKTMLVNARLSEKSYNGYKRFNTLTRQMLEEINCIAAQAQPDAQRFIQLGAEQDKVEVTGSLKFDMDMPDVRESSLPLQFQQIKESKRPVLIAASTREGEEQKVLKAFQQCLAQHPSALLILVPRHPERFNRVARLCEEYRLPTLRRSSSENCTEQTQVFLGDSMGEMWLYYSLADIAFVGGSLVETGCHNVLEPAAMGIPVIVGPSQFNFETVCNQLQKAGALITVHDEQDLAHQFSQLISNKEWRRAMGSEGRSLVESNRGSLERLSRLIALQLQ